MNHSATQASSLEDFFASLDSVEDKRSSTHGAHPYPAKFIPQIPRVLIAHYSSPGDTVLDPMCGSGTTLVESALAGRHALGVDINPVSTLISEAKTCRLDLKAETELKSLITFMHSGSIGFAQDLVLPNFKNRDHWFAEDVSCALATILKRIEELKSPSATLLARSALSSIVVAVSRQDSETRWVRRENSLTHSDVFRRYSARLEQNLVRAVGFTNDAPSVTTQVWNADARDLPIGDESVDLIVTSPPYANSHDYYLYNKLRMFWLGFDVRPVQEGEVGSRNKHSDQRMPFSSYMSSMRSVLSECARVAKPSARICVVVGDAVIRGEFFDAGDHFSETASELGLAQESRLDFHQQKYTRAFTSGFGTKLPKKTHVLTFVK
ncbi:hypothetical protein CXX84_03900 [Arthrobacter sp. AFG7.2]|uniref:TRM11 family SAM-dependent methyltransferase n=1 Tax=Arthrobacter sp. AFG7.2 TaxID=1688693 RepID=UPI000C9EAEA4|nr:DNA methyltransferase [Arthrobacter sp. AFG7.2]PNI09418.1 hypothetical protein CXX84_03900 [Arthrobacter sp. AFG7.2]